MASITYTALRNLERTGYAKSGADISVAAGDDSFNASVTNLSGLASGDWLLVSGFANAVNNGWFQASGASSATKISQGTRTDLVTESAGPAISLVGYKRGLGQSYAMDFGVKVADYGSRSQRSSHQPIGGGAPEVVHLFDESSIQVTTSWINETALLQWREFLSSVASGEAFTFDRYGTNASPIDPRQAVLQSDRHSEVRDANVGSGYPGVYRISFAALLLN